MAVRGTPLPAPVAFRLLALRARGVSVRRTARQCGVSLSTGQRYEALARPPAKLGTPVK
jgi:lambda repressor-like predicted transcriptional regulator